MSRVFGIILIVLGLIGLIWGGFTYTTRKTLVDVGPVHATKDEKHDVPLPPIIGLVAFAGGLAVLIAGRRA